MSAPAAETTGSVESTDCGARVLELETAIAAALEQLAHYRPEDWDMRFVRDAKRILGTALGVPR